MNKTTQQIRKTIIAVLLMATAVFTANAQSIGEEFKTSQFYCKITKLSPKEVEITDNVNLKGDLTIPDKVEYKGEEYAITSIGQDAFHESKLTSVNTGNSVRSIGLLAFWLSPDLSSVTIGASVKSIGNGAFSELNKLKSITIPNTVETLGTGIFWGCLALETVNLPNNMKHIPNHTFSHCSSLSFIDIPNSVTSIGSEVFGECTKLSSITIPNTVISIGKKAFCKCSSLKSVNLSNNLTKIEIETFGECKALKSIVIPNSVISIESYVFEWCEALESITLSESLAEYGDDIFNHCTSLKTIFCKIPDPKTNYDLDFEQKVYNEAMLIVPNGTKSKYMSVQPWLRFKNIKEEKEYAPLIGTRFEDNGLYYEIVTIDNVNVVSQNKTTPLWNDDKKPKNDITIPATVTYNGKSYSVVSVDNQAFKNCDLLTSVTLPNSITNIGKLVFADCEKLTAINIPANVTNIGEDAFFGCKLSSLTCMVNDLSKLTLAPNLFSIINLQNCVLTVPKGKRELYKSTAPFSDVFKVIRDEDGIGWAVWHEGVPYLITSSNEAKIINRNQYRDYTTEKANVAELNTDIVVPETIQYNGKDYQVTEIGDNAFAEEEKIPSVKLPKTIKHIGKGAFKVCRALTKINIPNAVTVIEDETFVSCGKLSNIKIPNSIVSIGKKAFWMCDVMSPIIIPKTVKSIGDKAFGFNVYRYVVCEIEDLSSTNLTLGENIFMDINMYTCLQSILFVPKGLEKKYKDAQHWKTFLSIRTIEDTTPLFGTKFKHNNLYYQIITKNEVRAMGWDKNDKPKGEIVIPDKVSYGGKDYFVTNVHSVLRGCSEVTSVVIPNAVTGIGSWSFNENAFKSIKIPNKVRVIEYGAFEGCKNLKEINIPNSVRVIKDFVFNECEGLSVIKTTIENPSEVYLTAEALKGFDKDKCTLIVPQGTIDKYRQAPQWKEFKNIIEDNDYVAVTGVSLDKDKLVLQKEELFQLKATLSPDNPTNKTVFLKYSVPNCVVCKKIEYPEGESVAILKFKAYKEGKVTITVHTENGDYTDMCEVEVVSIKQGDKFDDGILKYEVTKVLPNEVKVIGYKKTPTNTLTIPKIATCKGKECTVVSIGEKVFDGCDKLTSVEMPNTITRIDDFAFRGTALTQISISKEVTHIGNGILAMCKSLNTIFVEDGNEKYTSKDGILFYQQANANNEMELLHLIQYPAGKTSTIYTLPNTILTIKGGAFAGCEILEEINMPEQLYSIEGAAFFQCSSLKEIILPNTVEIIGGAAFYQCTSLTTIFSHIENPEKVNLGEFVFLDVDKDKCTIIVPGGTYSKYKNAKQWKDFNIIVKTTGVTISEPTKELKVNDIFTVTATIQPEDATNKNITWSSSDNNVATVNENGLVTAIAEGTADITVTTEDGGFTATCKVTVTKATGINDNIANNINIYPTLVSNGFVVETSKVSKTFEVCLLEIYTLTGKKVKTIKLTSQKQFVDVSNLQAGVYIAKVGNEVIKFVKQ